MSQGRNRRRKRKLSTWCSLLLVLLAAALAAGGYQFSDLLFEQDLPVDQGAYGSVGPAAETQGQLTVHFLDVGQGDAALLRVPKEEEGYHTVLIDTGVVEQTPFVTAYLQAQEVTRIDVLICTHQHADHMGAMAEIVKTFEVGALYMPLLPEDLTPTTRAYEALLNAAAEKGLFITELQAGREIAMPAGAAMEVLAPQPGACAYEDVNNYSGVLRFQFGAHSFLFTGDAEKESEREMLTQGGELSATVLSVGHHGSRTSTTAAFLSEVNPDYAVISCGADNDYGHPHSETLVALEEQGCKVYRTDQNGTIVFSSDGTVLTVTTERLAG